MYILSDVMSIQKVDHTIRPFHLGIQQDTIAHWIARTNLFFGGRKCNGVKFQNCNVTIPLANNNLHIHPFILL